MAAGSAGAAEPELLTLGAEPSARALAWLRLFHASLMVPNFEGDELEPVEEWEAMLSADAEERAGEGELGAPGLLPSRRCVLVPLERRLARRGCLWMRNQPLLAASGSVWALCCF